jgi:tocopherol cyclase
LINNAEINFTEGTGYIEKDWGTSFPESWIWLHCNTFKTRKFVYIFGGKNTMAGKFLYRSYLFSLCRRKISSFCHLQRLKNHKTHFSCPGFGIEIKNKTHTLKVKAVQNRSGDLKAPVTGEMNRIIKESVDSTIEIELFDNENKIIFSIKERVQDLKSLKKSSPIFRNLLFPIFSCTFGVVKKYFC